MSEEEATINPDGTQTMGEDAAADAGADYADAGGAAADDADDVDADAGEEDFAEAAEEAAEEVIKGTDPAIFLLLGFALIAALWFVSWYKKKKEDEESDSFFTELDGEKFNLKLPDAVDEYYEVKAKCEAAGWEPGQPAPQGPGAQNASGPHRMLAQALMKRCIADIPIVQHIQKESGGMNKLYSQSMCSVKQWKSYQAAENMVSAEVDEVRAEADEIEPGWSQVIWRQAMQYHSMLKQRQEAEESARKAMAEQKAAEAKKLTPEEEAKKKEEAAEKAAKELLQAEEREKEGKKAFKEGSMKKGFLSGKK